MASAVQICNQALSHVGSEARVSSISPPDGSVEAGHCAAFYDQARTELLEPGNWRFALKRAALAQTTNLSTAWAFAYVLPSDCLRALRILRASTAVTVFTQDNASAHTDDRNSAPFDLEGDVLYSNEPDAILVYSKDVTDTTKFSASFTATFGHLLASYLAGPIVKGNEGTRLGIALRQQAMSLADVSATSSANASSEDNNAHPSIVAARA
jgi:hypothetical protein